MLTPIKFIGAQIEVTFDEPPTLEKTPGCPNGFRWRDENFQIVEFLEGWLDTARRGRFERNMQPEHLSVAANRGSWGVGKFFFRVRTDGGRLFELYYDRAPKDARDRKGSWHLRCELQQTD